MNNKGFTLIELIIVIVILGVLSVTAVPKFVDFSGDAETSTASAVMSAFESSTRLHHYQWNLAGKPTSLSSGSNTIPLSIDGWPSARPDGSVGNASAEGCINLWNSMLASKPAIEGMVTDLPAPDWTTFAFGTACIYAFQNGRAFNNLTVPFFAYYPVSLPLNKPVKTIQGGSVTGFNFD